MNPLFMAAGIMVLALKASSAGSGSVSAPGSSSQDPDTRFDDIYRRYATLYGIPFAWVKAFALNESSNGRDPLVARGLAEPTDVDGSKSRDGKSWGLMQVTLSTAHDYDPAATAELLNDPDYCVDIACQYIRHLTEVFPIVMPNRLEYIAKAYNHGEGNVQRELEQGLAPPAAIEEYWQRFQRNLARVQGG